MELLAYTTLAYTWGTGLLVAAIVVGIVVWVIGALGVLRRRDLGAGRKTLWLVVLLVLPIAGLLVWYLWQAANPDRGARPA